MFVEQGKDGLPKKGPPVKAVWLESDSVEVEIGTGDIRHLRIAKLRLTPTKDSETRYDLDLWRYTDGGPQAGLLCWHSDTGPPPSPRIVRITVLSIPPAKKELSRLFKLTPERFALRVEEL
jgi:hypothetical protein